jgi:hypothetical protein
MLSVFLSVSAELFSRHVPLSIKSFRRVGVPTAIPVLVFLRNLIASLILMCFAKSLATVASFVWNFRMTLGGALVLAQIWMGLELYALQGLPLSNLLQQ